MIAIMANKVSLDALVKQKEAMDNAVVPLAQPELPSDSIPAVPSQLADFTPEEQTKINQIKESIDLTNTNQLMTFGNSAQKNVASFSNSVLETVKTKDSGHVGELLNQLVNKVEEYDESGISKFLKNIPIFGSLVNKAEGMVDRYSSLATQVDKITSELELAKMNMLKDINLFDYMYQKNYEYFKELCMYIEAGEETLLEVQTTTLPQLKQEAIESNDPMKQQIVADFENTINRFEKKLHDMKLSKTIAIQTAPQIRLIQNNDKALVDKIQSTVYNTIPLWKNQMVIALGVSNQAKVIKMQQAISNTTNDLLKKNAEMLKINSIETAKENERGIVDIETVQKVNEELIETIHQTLEIQKNGRAKRQEAEQKLIGIENELKKALASASNRSY